MWATSFPPSKLCPSNINLATSGRERIPRFRLAVLFIAPPRQKKVNPNSRACTTLLWSRVDAKDLILSRKNQAQGCNSSCVVPRLAFLWRTVKFGRCCGVFYRPYKMAVFRACCFFILQIKSQELAQQKHISGKSAA